MATALLRRAFGCAVGAAVLAAALAAGAAEPGRCLELEALRAHVLDDARIGEPFASLRGRSFYRSPSQRMAFAWELEVREAARARCRLDRAPYLPRWHVVLRLSSAQVPPEQVDASGAAIFGVRGLLRDDVLADVTVERVRDVTAQSGLDADPEAAAFLIGYLQATDREAAAARARGELSMAQAVVAAQYLGYLANERYDYGKRRSLQRPIVPPSEVFDAAAAALEGTRPELSAGTCADVANAQAELLERLGAKDVVLATTAHLPGLHTTVMARDPRGQIYHQINFDLATRTSRREGADLFQVPGAGARWVDLGPGVYLNRPNGPTVGYLPTHAGKLYAEAAGMDLHLIEPLARANSSLLGAQLALPLGQSLQTFVARDATGSFYGGLALTQAWAQHTPFPGAAGLVTAARRTEQGLAVADLYLQVEQHAVSPALHLGRGLRASADAALVLVGTYVLPFSDFYDATLGADAALFLNGGAQLAAGATGAPLAARLRVQAQVMPGLANIAGATPTVFLNHVVVSAEARARLGARPLYLVGGAAALFDAFGPRVATRLGLEGRRFAVGLETVGRVVEDDPTYKEGSLRRVRLIAGVPIERRLRASVLAELHEASLDAWWTVTGALDGRF